MGAAPQEKHQPCETGKDQRAQHGSHEVQDRAGPLGCQLPLGRAQTCGSGDEHGAGYAAADRCLGQRDIHGGKPHPNERQQQAKRHKADDGREGRLCTNGPDSHAQHQQGQSGIERQRDGHACRSPRRMVRATIWVTVAPANWASSQTATSFSAAR